MTRRRWLADEVSGTHAALTGTHADHLIRVLRARVGQEFDISTGFSVHCGRITKIGDQRVEFELGEEIPTEAKTHITLALSIFKFDRMEWAIEKCTELGAEEIVPLIAHRTDTHLAAASVKRIDRWKRIAREAAEQSRRATLPEVAMPLRIKEAAGLQTTNRILLNESEEQVNFTDALDSCTPGSSLLLAIGPEGGWTEAEQQLFRASDWVSASLGETILRTETAAIAAVAIAMSRAR